MNSGVHGDSDMRLCLSLSARSRWTSIWATIYKVNQMKMPMEFADIREKVEALVAAGEVDQEEVKPEFVEKMLVLD